MMTITKCQSTVAFLAQRFQTSTPNTVMVRDSEGGFYRYSSCRISVGRRCAP